MSEEFSILRRFKNLTLTRLKTVSFFKLRSSLTLNQYCSLHYYDWLIDKARQRPSSRMDVQTFCLFGAVHSDFLRWPRGVFCRPSRSIQLYSADCSQLQRPTRRQLAAAAAWCDIPFHERKVSRAYRITCSGSEITMWNGGLAVPKIVVVANVSK